MRKIMLDLETLGTRPGCAISQIAAVDDAGAEFSRYVKWTTERGFTIDAGTLLWWQGKPKALAVQVAAQTHSAVPVEQALGELAAWIGMARPIEVWANSPSFDCEILREACRKVGVECPWTFRDERDFRTAVAIAELCPDRRGIEAVGRTDAHDALWDARAQADGLRALGVW
jgi:exodeoxyribonuclease VIII